MDLGADIAMPVVAGRLMRGQEDTAWTGRLLIFVASVALIPSSRRNWAIFRNQVINLSSQ